MSIMKLRKKHRVVKVIGMAVCVVVVLTAGLFFRLMTDTQIIVGAIQNLSQTSVYKGYKQDKIEMRDDRAEMSDFPLYLNTVAGGLDRRD